MLLRVCRVPIGASRHPYHDGLVTTTEIIQLLTDALGVGHDCCTSVIGLIATLWRNESANLL